VNVFKIGVKLTARDDVYPCLPKNLEATIRCEVRYLQLRKVKNEKDRGARIYIQYKVIDSEIHIPLHSNKARDTTATTVVAFPATSKLIDRVHSLQVVKCLYPPFMSKTTQ